MRTSMLGYKHGIRRCIDEGEVESEIKVRKLRVEDTKVYPSAVLQPVKVRIQADRKRREKDIHRPLPHPARH